MNIKYLASTMSLSLALAGTASALTLTEQVGKNIFFDTNLSEPAGQGCVSCHDPSAGFAEPDKNLPVSEGVIPGRFGGRNSPAAAYATFTPLFTLSGGVRGGQFWDGRAADLTAQAEGPFLNSLEMNNTSKEQVLDKIYAASYGNDFRQVCGTYTATTVNTVYTCMASTIAAYEGTSELNKFTSKFDAYMAGTATLTAQEEQGRQLFSGNAKCAHCHTDSGSRTVPALFTDFKYHNIGLPKNTEFPFSATTPTDLGLAGTTGNSKHNGKFKTPHLRNIAETGPYMHNGLLKTLKDVVHFYNTRDVAGAWPAPEVPATVEGSFLGNLGLTDAEEDALVAFMMTFSDQ
ncbi:MAG: cytochrome c peroxidase [Gallionellaceae bacterium]|nr:cytochrome c peroxidase [Gallionellaceae bacterium]